MNARLIGAVVLNEMRMRTRRVSTLVALFAVVAITWMMVADPSTGHSMVVVNKTRLAYNSTVLAMGSAMLGSILFGLGSFYLVRGRTHEDLIHGTGGILAATPVSNALFLFARWLGAVAYLGVLVLAVMATMMVLQLVRGEGAIEPFTFLQMYGLILMPAMFFTASIAVLCDAFPPLMGKGGDVVYFILWLGQFTALPATLTKKTQGLEVVTAFDFSGLAFTAHRMTEVFGTHNFAIGGVGFDASLGTMVLSDFWTMEMIGFRMLSALLAMVPLLLAIALFHRYSPDRVKAVSANTRTSIVALMNRLLRPATMLVRPLLRLASRLPGMAGQALADMASLFMANPAALVALVVVMFIGVVASPQGLGGVLAAAIVCWGILVSDLSVRDYQSATEPLTAAVPGGASRRYVRQWLVTAMLGLLFALPVLMRWIAHAPLRAGALLAGVLALSAVASLLGRMTRTGRTFLALFLFGMYLASQIKTVQWFDAVGINGSATVQSVLAYLAAGALALGAGYLYETRRHS